MNRFADIEHRATLFPKIDGALAPTILFVTDIRHYPVVLVHGWKSHSGVWKRFLPFLAEKSIPFWNFNYGGMQDPCLNDLSHALGDFIRIRRDETGYDGPVDIICHCMGTCISRYLLEIIDGTKRRERVRQLVGLGPPNNGSSIAELFCDPGLGQEMIEGLSGIFIPEGFDLAEDTIVREFRPGSSTMARLRNADRRTDIRYRLILTRNILKTPDFFSLFDGKTWQFSPEDGWVQTYEGDGIVPHTDSFLPGADHRLLPASPGLFCGSPHLYSHLQLPYNPEVIDELMQYLLDPTPSLYHDANS
jgi:triacylglycerol lipase